MKNGRYSIGEISRLCCIPVSRLRYYDETGVIRPCFVDSESGYRYYDNETLLLISVLKYYQACGFKLRQIIPLLERLDLDHLEPLFDAQIAALEQKIRGLQMQRDSIAAWRDLIREERAAMAQENFPIHHRYYTPTVLFVSKPYVWENMSYHELIANIDMCNRLTVRSDTHNTVGPLYLYFPHGQRRAFHDSKIYILPHPASDLTGAETETVPACRALCTYHKGSFETGEEAYERLYDYAAAHHIPLRGDSFERSVIDWWSTKKEEEFLLEIILPTAEKAEAGTLPVVSF